MPVESECDVVFGLVELGDLTALKKFTPATFDWAACGGRHNTPVLHAAILGGLRKPSLSAAYLDIIRWLLQKGSDPQQRTPAKRFPYIWAIEKGWDEEGLTTTKIPISGCSAISLTLAVLQAFEDSNVDWSPECNFLNEVVSALASRPTERARVAVAPAILGVWESILDLTATHNVTFETAGAEVTAHDVVLMATSPVLRAMLESSMQEGKQRRIQVRDAPQEGVALLVDMLYTNATRRDPGYQCMLVALDLAHRWQVQHVVQALSEALIGTIAVNSFVAIAESAVLKDLDVLKSACATFGGNDPQVQAMLKEGKLPSAVSSLLGQREGASEEPSAKKRRIF